MTAFTGTIPTFSAGQTTTVPTDLNTMGNALKGLSEAWTVFASTPTGFTVGNGTLTFRYAQVNKLVFCRVYFAAGSTSSYTATPMALSLPVAAHATGNQVWTALLNVSTGGNSFAGIGSIAASGTAVTPILPAATGNCALAGLVSGGQTPGTTGSLVLEGYYEAA